MSRKKILLIGHSHAVALANGISVQLQNEVDCETIFLNKIQSNELGKHRQALPDLIVEKIRASISRLIKKEIFIEEIHSSVIDNNITTVLAIGGNAHNVIGLLQIGEPFDFNIDDNTNIINSDAKKIPYYIIKEQLNSRLMHFSNLLCIVSKIIKNNLFQLESPPPIKDCEYIKAHIGPYFKEIIKDSAFDIVEAPVRLKLWQVHSRLVREHCEKAGIVYITVPAHLSTEEGFLRAEAYNYRDATHANAWYGAEAIKDLLSKTATRGASRQCARDSAGSAVPKKALSPYSTKLPHAFWKKSIEEIAPHAVDPIVGMRLRINRQTKIATAGSCFAQHIARRLNEKGFTHLVTEKPHPVLTPEIARKNNYGTFSARYGNIYTSRQLVQLFDRAYGGFMPIDEVWAREDGKLVDPFRPRIQPNGFCSRDELLDDRERHLASVRDLFEHVDVFIFTLGLTETWMSKEDGAVYPICPGVAGGEFDPARHAFMNLTVADVVSDMRGFLHRLMDVNAHAQILLTVSPVSLIATATDNHVLVANTYSKSVLRAAAGELCESDPHFHYFPAFEIITGSFSRGIYYAEDAREVRETGVDHVMRLFFLHLAGESESFTPEPVPDPSLRTELQTRIEAVVETICDEEVLGWQANPAGG